MAKKVKVAIAGLGSRGKDTYAPTVKLFPDKMEITAIADIVPEKVTEVARLYNIPENRCFNSAEELLKQDKLADILIIATQDRQHVAHALPALEKGYDLLLEKPVSPEPTECRTLVNTAKKYNRRIVVCHVLRYTPFFLTLKKCIDDGRIGKVVSIMAIENVGWYHQAHSFVRGNWANSHVSSPMILQKCCHDMDLYLWLTGKTCESVSSYGDTYLFKKENAPEGSTPRCLDGCKVKDNCPYDAEKIYMNNPVTGVLTGNTGWPLDTITLHPSEDTVRKALKEGPYGRCVYHCDNNVVDHQVVNVNMTDGTTMSFTMSGFTSTNTRYCKIMGTMGEIIADMHTNTIQILPFGKEAELIDIAALHKNLSGHAGGDSRMVEEFLDIISGKKEMTSQITSIEQSIESHYLAFAAEQSRLAGGEAIRLDTYRKC